MPPLPGAYPPPQGRHSSDFWHQRLVFLVLYLKASYSTLSFVFGFFPHSWDMSTLLHMTVVHSHCRGVSTALYFKSYFHWSKVRLELSTKDPAEGAVCFSWSSIDPDGQRYNSGKLPGPLQKREILPLMLGVSLRLLYCSAPGRTPRLLRSYEGEKTTVPCSELSFWKKSRAQLFSKVTLPKILIRQHIVCFSRQPSGTQKTNNPVLQFVS